MKMIYKYYRNKPFLIVLALGLGLASCQKVDPNQINDNNLSSNEVQLETENDLPPAEINNRPIEGQYMILLKDEATQHLPLTERSSVPDPVLPENPSYRDGSSKKAALARNEEIMQQECEKILEDNKISADALKDVYAGIINGMVATISAEEAEKLANDERIDLVEQDQMMAFSFFPQIRTPFLPSGKLDWTMSDYTSYGVKRVGGSRNFEKDPQNYYRWAWIVDTGIDMDHNDLNVDSKYSRNYSSSSTLDDRQGHGTHVAGIVAAKDNNRGTQGVAAGATVVNIKVLDDKGEGSYSQVISGINYAGYCSLIDDVINVSLGGAQSSAVDNIIEKISNKGLKIVIAAGNAGQDADTFSPGRVNSNKVFTVGAVDASDKFEWYSNFGSSLDYAAPGSYILSTFKNDTYAVVSGTSMAAPHMTGVLILSNNSFSSNGSSSAMPTGRTLPIISH